MGKIDFLTGSWTVDEVESKVSGKITVIKSFAFGTYLSAGNLTQSGGVVYDVWRSTLKKVKGKRQEIKDCLILGLGGGSAAKLVRKFWTEAKITGVDLDPVMIDLGKKYLGLDKLGVDIKIGDAVDFVKKSQIQNSKSKLKYDLILVDLYVGDEFPEKFETEVFLKLTLKPLTDGGIVVFNRLYYGEKRAEAMRFLKTLEKVYKKVDVVYPEANIMFVCEK
ncbi:hypothetical protein A2685_03260 [Candidatus Woesebacteria bacterium RIFCSPHIGHO2_01_FULL_37_10]|uniref:PABS domain-containing protein n=1 Tax=Candidatus Woesebacteria bacterium RIFCSPHIGHO2_01_FULL_37_10 TaxID=1802489 RepID=A0A1F7XX13_9BACT|nr:MAG: hypothetical protein A2685_03260 [Candidatus Woesebacteria bacterium RIFCSPHIGHO2_01_FULL_37_10]